MQPDPKGVHSPMKLAIEYSFRLRYQDNIHEVTIPAGRLLNVPLDVEAVRRIVEHDDVLKLFLRGEESTSLLPARGADAVF